MCKFRDLRADEIECRVQSVKENGLVLLLYKDARVDMNILDETVGARTYAYGDKTVSLADNLTAANIITYLNNTLSQSAKMLTHRND